MPSITPVALCPGLLLHGDTTQAPKRGRGMEGRRSGSPEKSPGKKSPGKKKWLAAYRQAGVREVPGCQTAWMV